MKVLFLDIDGVLNSAAYLEANPGAFDRDDRVNAFDPAACARLQRLLERTGAAVVVSSSWRVVYPLADIERWLHARGVAAARCVGRTPVLVAAYSDHPEDDTRVLVARERGAEIREWLAAHAGQWDAFAIVDDNGVGADIEHMQVRTTWNHGLLDEHVEALCDLLGDDAGGARGA